MILGIDTSGNTCSVALYHNEKSRLLGEVSIYSARTHSQMLMPMIEKLLSDFGLGLHNLDLITVAHGPGSYTGLRIGISAALGLVYGLGISCAGISTLKGLAANVCSFDGFICAIIKARQNLVYTGIYDNNLKVILPDCVIATDELAGVLSKLDKVILVGDSAEDFYNEHSQYKLAPYHMLLQHASGICYAARSCDIVMPEDLKPVYLQEFFTN